MNVDVNYRLRKLKEKINMLSQRNKIVDKLPYSEAQLGCFCRQSERERFKIQRTLLMSLLGSVVFTLSGATKRDRPWKRGWSQEGTEISQRLERRHVFLSSFVCSFRGLFIRTEINLRVVAHSDFVTVVFRPGGCA